MYEKLNCRLCGGAVKPVFSLTPTPIANGFAEKPDAGAERFPLDLTQCPECAHVQMRYVFDSETLYGDYKYSTPRAFIPHLEAHARKLKAAYPSADKVLEIGSNNGQFLEILRKHFRAVVGVDPASPDHRFCHRFTHEYAKELAQEWKFDLIVANNVFAHIDDLHDVFDGIQKVLSPEGALVFEVQYLPEMVRGGTFDMIYHEHHDYHQLNPLGQFLRSHRLYMADYEYIPTHGGSIRVTAKWQTPDPRFNPKITPVYWANYDGTEKFPPPENIDWGAFALRIEQAKEAVLGQLKGAERIIAYGATAKACTLIHHFGLADRIKYCVDSTPQKQGRYIPGTDIKIVSTRELCEIDYQPDAVLLTAWNYEREIRAQHPGLNFVVPFSNERLKEAA